MITITNLRRRVGGGDRETLCAPGSTGWAVGSAEVVVVRACVRVCVIGRVCVRVCTGRAAVVVVARCRVAQRPFERRTVCACVVPRSAVIVSLVSPLGPRPRAVSNIRVADPIDLVHVFPPVIDTSFALPIDRYRLLLYRSRKCVFARFSPRFPRRFRTCSPVSGVRCCASASAIG